jgi:hypothetical protein
MRLYLVTILATRTPAGSDEPLIWTHRVPAVSAQAAINSMWRNYPGVVDITAIALG